MNLDSNLNESFWNERYRLNDTGWDLGHVSPPLKTYIDQLTDKNLRILIPGCGNSYEAEYLLEMGFTNITIIDIAPELVKRLKSKFRSNQNIKIILGDFFTHRAEYDLILEQTFFCALDPKLRKNYAEAMKGLLIKGGKLAGVLFNKEFETQGPPFGGTDAEYLTLFGDAFNFRTFESCYNSFSKRADSELFVILEKK
ncbi:methyltransferase domain-containing protein [Daejeonella sp.]|uniref:methyltransferase domain-containing protein n=1 Tax=Daejeonella sp. TaxID=2805397 RepID=UPI00272EEF46|nr:methyltransferase domain-containing protein [Daejeonella sp.]MDP2414463.1 methyltransferase domain-containing protein [Daejeonella sp.]